VTMREPLPSPRYSNGITLRTLLLPASVGQVSRALQSPSRARAPMRLHRRWRTCEYPIFAAFHFPLFCLYLISLSLSLSLSLDFFPRCLSSRELFNCLFSLLDLYFFPFSISGSLHLSSSRPFSFRLVFEIYFEDKESQKSNRYCVVIA